MSQHYDYPPPPSPISAGTAGTAGTASGLGHGGQAVQRRRPISAIFPPNISTNVVGISGAPIDSAAPHHGTSAQQIYTPASPAPWTAGGFPSSQTHLALPGGGTSMEPYNPRQWGHRGQVSGSQMVIQQRAGSAATGTTEITGMEANMPSPPPPYTPNSPDNSHRGMSPRMDNIGSVASPLVTEASTRHSPQMPMSPAFPPPPGPSTRHRERSSSGLAGQRGFFGLSGLRGKQPVYPDLQPAPTSNPTQPAFNGRPPAARRAASAGQMHSNAPGASSSSAVAAGRDSPESAWQPGMPLPGPPPGPPPAGNRSQSLNRPFNVPEAGSSGSDRTLEAPRPRRVLPRSTLGPVPPTPADWVAGAPNPSDPPMPAHQHSAVDGANIEPLRIDTGRDQDSSLTRRPAKRGESASGLRDRRSRSRAAKGSDEAAGPSNLVFSPLDGAISRRREHTRTSSAYVDLQSAPTSGSGGNSSGNSGSTTKATDVVLTPPYTPAVGRSADDQSRKQVLKVPGSASSDRPISHVLHTPNEVLAAMPAPLSSSRLESSGSYKVSTGKLDAFALQAIERHRTFVEKEIAAGSDEERLELFASFIVHESRLRRDRYTAAYNAMAGEVNDLTRDLWRSYTRGPRRAPTPSTTQSSLDPTIPSWASDGQPNSARGSSFGDFTPGTDSASNGDTTENGERQWPEAFKPSLSPIPSMNVSTVPDEDDSRGRTASRWWEQSVTGSGSIGRPDRIEKSRRETKYMGVTPATLQESNDDPTSNGPNRMSQPYGYGPDEYPPEKVGWHESYDYDTPMATPHRNERSMATPRAEPLDVSRLVTLPPPYPRHHPALSNSHPLLAELRSEHRILAQHDEIQKIKLTYRDKDTELVREQQEAATRRRARLRSDVQGKIASGSMSFADAAKAEADFDTAEAERGKTTARSNFDVFEASVSHPMNALLTERLARANKCIADLTTELQSGHEEANPDQAQEEGDERPERLEKLTLLKWLFEARELLHKEMFELHHMRSEKYSEVILTPYRISKQQSKIDEAAAFFKKDGRERQITFAKESLKRVEVLQAVVDKNVSRGVEDQLSAFWDIAPGLLEVIQHIPHDMSSFEIAIPAQEYNENPSFHQHPLQYLYSLLNHAQKSAYQFIESQINLLCLVHEVHTATSKSSLRLVEMERHAASPDDGDIRAEMEQARRGAEDQLTRELKDKVGEVERQWKEALGDGMAECRERVREFFEGTGGWEDGLEV